MIRGALVLEGVRSVRVEKMVTVVLDGYVIHRIEIIVSAGDVHCFYFAVVANCEILNMIFLVLLYSVICFRHFLCNFLAWFT